MPTKRPSRNETGNKVSILSGYILKKRITKSEANKKENPFSIIRIKNNLLPIPIPL
jgi:hypothetical protein